jgi:hypothetical protein
MNEEIVVRLEPAGARPRFLLKTASGAVPHVTSAVVLDDVSGAVVWSLAPTTLASAPEPDDDGIGTLVDAEEEPWEDLHSSAPRHPEAMAAEEEFRALVSFPLPVVEYGVVPAGFGQTHPVGREAPGLDPGVPYVFHVSGVDGLGFVDFKIDEKA